MICCYVPIGNVSNSLIYYWVVDNMSYLSMLLLLF